MIYFIEYDSAGNICAVANNTTTTDVADVATFDGSDGLPLKDANGNSLSIYGLVLAPPVAITKEQFGTLVSYGIANYTYDSVTATIAAKPSA